MYLLLPSGASTFSTRAQNRRVYNAQTARNLAKAYLKEKKTDYIDASILANLLIDGKFPTSMTRKISFLISEAIPDVVVDTLSKSQRQRQG